MARAPRTTRALDTIIASVRQHMPAVRLEQLQATHPADDIGVWYVEETSLGTISLESPAGEPPFLMEADFHHHRCTVHSLEDASDIVVAWLTMPRPATPTFATDLVVWARRMVLARLERLRSKLGEQHPDLKLVCCDDSVGSATSFAGHAFNLECFIPDAPQDAPNHVTFGVELCHLTSVPRVLASVTWGSPSGHTEASVPTEWRSQDDWPAFDAAAITDLVLGFPALETSFSTAVGRRAPPNTDR